MITKTRCEGSNTKPKITIQNDWWVGTTGICPTCRRTLKLVKKGPQTGTLPNHAKKETPSG